MIGSRPSCGLQRARTEFLEINLCPCGKKAYATRSCDLTHRCINDFRKSAHCIYGGFTQNEWRGGGSAPAGQVSDAAAPSGPFRIIANRRSAIQVMVLLDTQQTHRSSPFFAHGGRAGQLGPQAENRERGIGRCGAPMPMCATFFHGWRTRECRPAWGLGLRMSAGKEEPRRRVAVGLPAMTAGANHRQKVRLSVSIAEGPAIGPPPAEQFTKHD
jgi:hypothetical protein